MPKNRDELVDLWEADEYVDESAKRLIIFAPDSAGWSEIGQHWTNTIRLVSEAGNGMAEKDYDTILDSIANTI